MFKTFRLAGTLSLLFILNNVSAQTFKNTGGGPIPDNGPEVCFPVTVSGLPAVADSTFGLASVCVNITHPFDANIVIRLKSPSGKIIVLSNQNGSHYDDYTSCCFTENSTILINNGTAPFTGSFVPEESLNLLNDGQDPNGIWNLCIKDLMIGDSGSVLNYSLNFSNNPPHDPPNSFFPCGLSHPYSCKCPDTTSVNCDLLPDITVSGMVIKKEHSEFPGQIRLSVGTPNIGWGPLEIRGADTCYCDTARVNCSTTACPDGNPPKQMVMQRIYHKNNGIISNYERQAGTMSYHPSHGHIHVDNWVSMSLRKATSNPDPTTWPILGLGTKLSFCLINLGDCSIDYGYCVDKTNNILTNDSLPNAPFGVVSGCELHQGIFVGKLDIYDQFLPDMFINIPGICNGNYYIVCVLDSLNHILESDKSNNFVAVPITLTMQNSVPKATFTYSVTSGMVKFFAQTGAGYTYEWQFGDGGTDSVATPSHQYISDGIYTVRLVTSNMCGTDTAYKTLPFIVTRSPENTDDLVNIKTYPNPFNGELQLRFKLTKNTSVKLDLYDIYGNTVKNIHEGRLNSGVYDFALHNIPSGLYYVKYFTGKNSGVIRVLCVN